MSAMRKIAGYPDAEDAKPGMAFFVGTGPSGATCGGCKHRGYTRESKTGHWNATLGREVFKSYRVRSCAMFKKLSGNHGPPVENEWLACKYYEPK